MSRVILVSYAGAVEPGLNARLLRAQRAMNESAAIAGIDGCVSWDRSRLLKTAFYSAHREILDRPRGGGYWLWKPYIILEALRSAGDGDVVVYWDVGRTAPNGFRRPIGPLVRWCREHRGLLPGVPIGPQGKWTKRDCFRVMGCDAPAFWNAPQVQATFSLWSGPAAAEFVAEWLRWCIDRRCLTDDPNECGLPDLPDFVEHRHDQSILTNLCLLRGVPPLAVRGLPPGARTKDISAWAEALAAVLATATAVPSAPHAAAANAVCRVPPVRTEAAAAPPALDEARRLYNAGDWRQAEALCRGLLAREPRQAGPAHLLGLLCLRTGRNDEALMLLCRSVAADPGSAEYQNNLAVAFAAAGRHDRALAVLDQLIARHPGGGPPAAHANRGRALDRVGRHADACEAYRRALACPEARAEFPVIAADLGGALAKLGKAAEAEAAYRRALDADVMYTPASTGLARLLCQQAQHVEAVAVLRRAVALRPGDGALRSQLLYTLQYAPGISRDELFAEHSAWGRQHGAPLACYARRPHDNDRSPGRRLRVGYVSPDFRAHSTATFAEPLLAAHDRNTVEIFCYSATDSPDGVTARFRALAAGWRDIAHASDREAGEMIRRDRVDVLVDLTGHTGGSHLPLFAMRPAPVQVTYLGYPDTTGLDAIDCRLTDHVLDPPGASERYHSERVVARLARVVACYRPPDPSPGVEPLPAGRTGHVTFGCLNNPAKVTAEAARLWCRVLRAVPGSRLLIRYDAGAPALRQAAAAEGVDPARIERQGLRPDAGAYFETFNRIDVALDPFPYNGHTTSCDGFWMGVPLVTIAGDRYASRMGASLLAALGLDDLVASTAEEYVAIAARLARDLPRLADLRRTLRERMRRSPIMDPASLTSEIETIYRDLWRRWCSASHA